MKSRLLIILLVTVACRFTNAQCIPDPNLPHAGIFPDSATGLSPGYVNQAYNQVLQLKVPTDTLVDTGPPLGVQNVTIDTITLISFTGLPSGITYACNPGSCAYLGGTNGCALLSGTPTVAGTYHPVAITRTSASAFGGLVHFSQNDTIDYYTIVINSAQGLNNIKYTKFELFQNEPNPVFTTTNITFGCPVPMMVTLKVFNLVGKEILNKNYTADQGKNLIKFDADDLSSGVYVYSLSNGVNTFTRRMIVNKK